MNRVPGAATRRVTVRPFRAFMATLVVCTQVAAGARADARQRQGRIDEHLRREAEALVQLADDAAAGKTVPSEVSLTWQNDFLKAQPGTFVPFTISFRAAESAPQQALMYVRVQRLPVPSPTRTGSRPPRDYAYETIFPVRMSMAAGQSVRVRRGFAVAAGRYRVIVVLKQWAEGVSRPSEGRPLTGIATQELDVPDFWTGQLTTSSVILADRLEPLLEPVPSDELDEDPYVIGLTRIHPAASRTYTRRQELIAVFLVYNLSVGADKQFDLQVDYHLYRKDPSGQQAGTAREGGVRPGERYVTRTNSQRFSPSLMGPGFDPASGSPLLAGQGILLSDFEPGEYRLGITVTDLLSRRMVSRDVFFSVIGS